MPAIRKFPPTVEIKRVIAAAERAGIEIASIEIQPGRITIQARELSGKNVSIDDEFDLWKASQARLATGLGNQAGKTDAPPKKTVKIQKSSESLRTPSCKQSKELGFLCKPKTE
ncbi:MAG TPA: hypothetical protein VK533_05640 [Sphingomonas sp.]|uniref:hypothetical protein n=1 Tax=Sphingomonas sp. TaxID=28214 RepID=UPI002BB6EE54|nr:hypothetical protein [Sphingomonas sp.]HMI19008.1 hypothetical protein [Sphingomonas sp.]